MHFKTALSKNTFQNRSLKLGTDWGFKWILTEDFKFWIKSNITLT